MKIWNNRPREEAYLLNPAFCCTTLMAAIRGYSNVKEEGVPFPYAFMFLPIVLHKPTREMLPLNTRTSMAAWLHSNSEVRVLFYERLISLKPYTKEAIQFGMLVNCIIPKEGGFLGTTSSESDVKRAIDRLSGEARVCVMRARFLGKWFGLAGDVATVMSFWGVRP